MPKKEINSVLQLTTHSLERCTCMCHESDDSQAQDLSSVREVFWSKCWSPGFSVISKEDDDDSYGLYVRFSHNFMQASFDLIACKSVYLQRKVVFLHQGKMSTLLFGHKPIQSPGGGKRH